MILPFVAILFTYVSTWEGSAAVFLAKYVATTPATCGVAMDVPLKILVDVVLGINVDRIEDPGAKISTTDP